MAKAKVLKAARTAKGKRKAKAVRLQPRKPTRLASIAAPPGCHPDSFALELCGDCLVPRAMPGQYVIVEPVLPKVGDLCVLWSKGLPMPSVKILSRELRGWPHHPQSEVSHPIYIEQLNPPEKLMAWAHTIDRIARVHSIVDG